MNTSGIISSQIYEKNLGLLDRQVRAVIGFFMVLTPLISIPETMELWSIPMLASVLVITSAFMSWDPIYAVLGFSTYVANDEEIEQRNWTSLNLGIMDRVIRVAIGSIIFASLFSNGVVHAELVLALLAIPLVTTALMAWDPIYAVLGINSFGSRADVDAAEPVASEKTLAEYYVFPKVTRSDRDIPKAA